MTKKKLLFFIMVALLIICICACASIHASSSTNQSSAPSEPPNTESTSIVTNPHTEPTQPTPPTTEHQCVFGEWNITVNPTCTEDGQQTRSCVCGLTETQTIVKLNHDLTETVISILSCTENGITKITCSRCDYVNEITSEALGHQWGSYHTTKDATCTKKGTRQRTCTTCHQVDINEIAALGHQYNNGVCTRCKKEDPNHFPKKYSDDGVSITIHKVTGYGKGNTTCYIAEIQLKDYERFFTACGQNKYGGQSSTSAAAKLQNAIFAVNGCYSAPYLKYQVVRRGVLYNGGERNCSTPAVYSSMTGIFGSPEMLGVNGMKLSDAVAQGLVTDTFCFGPAGLVNGVNLSKPSSDRAQRTFIGSNGTPGYMVIGVSNGRYSDGVSAGLSYYEINEILLEYGCTFGVALDGGGSSTMVFNGQILNQLANNQERNWIVDFVCISKE